jgi:hypothetical protein
MPELKRPVFYVGEGEWQKGSGGRALPSKHETLSSNPSTSPKKKEKKKKERFKKAIHMEEEEE